MGKGFFIGLFAGMLVGGVVSLLAAPRSGCSTRRGIAEAVEPARETVNSVVEAIKARPLETVEHIRQSM